MSAPESLVELALAQSSTTRLVCEWRAEHLAAVRGVALKIYPKLLADSEPLEDGSSPCASTMAKRSVLLATQHWLDKNLQAAGPELFQRFVRIAAIERAEIEGADLEALARARLEAYERRKAAVLGDANVPGESATASSERIVRTIENLRLGREPLS